MNTLKNYLRQNKPHSVKKGLFTTAYLYENSVILRSNDPIKECMAHGWFPDSELFPVVKFSELESDDEDFGIYEMELLQVSRSVKNNINEWEYANIYMPLRNMMIDWDYFNSYNWHDNFRNGVNASELPEMIKELLISAYESCMNFSHKIRFEISPRNVASKNGKLILLDCFFIPKERKRIPV